jgi:Sec7-like guanine-nucleotide exchange factor
LDYKVFKRKKIRQEVGDTFTSQKIL